MKVKSAVVGQSHGETREEHESQRGAGVAPSFAGDEHSEAENPILSSGAIEKTLPDGKGAEAECGAAAPAPPLPCLNSIICNEGGKNGSLPLSSGQRKTAFALTCNVLLLIERHGLERIGFLTLTFDRQVVRCKEAQQALHSLMTGVLKERYPEYIIVLERMDSGRIHYHLLVVMTEDIRTGFDFEAVKRRDYRSASAYLKDEWKFWRKTAPRYGFGRTELLPIRTKAEGVARYVGKYVTKHIGQRLPEDKGVKLVRYSQGTNRVGTRFSWASPGARKWRAKLGAFCLILNYTPDNYQERLKVDFGKRWAHRLRPLIESIQLPWEVGETSARESVVRSWLIALNERERRHHRRRKIVIPAALPKTEPPARPPRAWASWMDRSVKEED